MDDNVSNEAEEELQQTRSAASENATTADNGGDVENTNGEEDEEGDDEVGDNNVVEDNDEVQVGDNDVVEDNDEVQVGDNDVVEDNDEVQDNDDGEEIEDADESEDDEEIDDADDNDDAEEHDENEDNNDDEDSQDNIEDGEGQPFDISLAASHSYMGPELMPVSGRSVLEAGWEGTVPVTIHHGIVFPGEIVPMLITSQNDAAMLMQVLEQDKLFGLLCPDETGTMVTGHGVLCEMFEFNFELAVSRLKVKARAIHRFRFIDMPRRSQSRNNYNRHSAPGATNYNLLRRRQPGQGIPIHNLLRRRMQWIKVRVLPELRRDDPLRPVRLASLDTLRRSRMDGRLRTMDATVTPWPKFVFDIFDYERLRKVIKDFFNSMGLMAVPEDPVTLSFWAASNLALSPRERLALFLVDDAMLRLHMEVCFIYRVRQRTLSSVLYCTACGMEITRRDYIFAMSSEGVHSNYTNIGGYMHDVVTVSRTSNTTLSGAPSAEFSWFPGYMWTIAHCSSCMAHVGWRFDAQDRSLRPQRFYGLCRNYVQPRMPPSPPRALSH